MSDSCIASVAYDPRTLTLTIEFQRGGSYNYLMVPPPIYFGVLEGGGSFFDKFIRDIFPFERVGEGSSELLEILELAAEDVILPAAEGALLL
jgi:hypothetical protein